MAKANRPESQKDMKNDKQKQALLEQLKKTPIVQIACEKLGIARATYYRWRQSNKKFAKLADEAIKDGSLLINDMAESQLISAIRDRNLTATIFWLKNHHNSYATKIEVNANVKNEIKKLSPQQKKLIKEAIRLMASKKHEQATPSGGDVNKQITLRP